MSLKVLVGMSGGVDSTVAAQILLNKGYTVAGVTLQLCQQEKNVVEDARAVCKQLGIEHYTLDLREEFKRYVMLDFVSQYRAGKTPNPCIVCNKFIKFGAMLQFALQLGFDKIATGHYARITLQYDKYTLLKAKDITKDQSYVLYNLTKNELSRVLFPLGELSKNEVRLIANELGLLNAKKPDSQDICFVPNGDYASFIENFDGIASEPGDYVDINGKVLGKHKGIIHYTLGQRKGLGIALGKPQFVIDKNAQNSQVVLGDEEYLFNREVLVENVNFISPVNSQMRVKAKLRYRHIESDAIIYPLDKNSVKIVFDEPQRAASSGQSAVFYNGDEVIGGGIIV